MFRTHALGVLAMCFATLLWAIIDVIPRFMSMPFSPYQIVWTRYAAHIVFMLVVFAPRFRMNLVRTKHLGWQIVRGLMMLGMPICLIVATNRMAANDAMAVFWISPFIVVTLAMIFLREKTLWWQWGIIFIAFIGALLIEHPSTQVLNKSLVLPIGMALFFGGYQFLTRLLRDESTLTGLFYTAACVLVPLSFALPWFWRTPALVDLMLMIAIGVIGFGGLYFLDRAYEIAPACIVAPFAFTQPIWTLLMHLALGVTPDARALVGTALIVGSGLVLGQSKFSSPVVNYEH